MLKIRGMSTAENLLMDANRLGHCLTSTMLHFCNSSTLSKVDIQHTYNNIETYSKINNDVPDALSLHPSRCSARFVTRHFSGPVSRERPGERAWHGVWLVGSEPRISSRALTLYQVTTTAIPEYVPRRGYSKIIPRAAPSQGATGACG